MRSVRPPRPLRLFHLSVFVLASCLSLLVPVAGCGAVQFTVEQDLATQTVPGSPSLLGGVLPSALFPSTPIDVDLKSATEKMNTGPATHVFLSSLTLSITPHANPQGNFDFLQEVHIVVASAKQGSTLPSVEIARVLTVGPGLVVLDFDVVPGVDLLPYINEGAQITSSAKGTQPKMDISFDGKIVLTVEV